MTLARLPSGPVELPARARMRPFAPGDRRRWVEIQQSTGAYGSVSGEMFDRLSEHFSTVRGYDGAPFGGLQIILFGDFLQLGPIDQTKRRTDTKQGFCPALFLDRGWAFESWSWQDLRLESVELTKVFRQQDEAFVDVLPAGSHPDTRSVRGANNCQIAVHRPDGGNVVVVLVIIDNLVKGASGQAVQNMNLMFGLEETMGLDHIALMP